LTTGGGAKRSDPFHEQNRSHKPKKQLEGKKRVGTERKSGGVENPVLKSGGEAGRKCMEEPQNTWKKKWGS